MRYARQETRWGHQSDLSKKSSLQVGQNATRVRYFHRVELASSASSARWATRVRTRKASFAERLDPRERKEASVNSLACSHSARSPVSAKSGTDSTFKPQVAHERSHHTRSATPHRAGCVRRRRAHFGLPIVRHLPLRSTPTRRGRPSIMIF